MARFRNGMRPIHPGEILREEYLVPLKMTPNALANALHVTATRINDIVRERRGITTDTALRLAQHFGGDAESWLTLQQTYDLQMTVRDHGLDIKNEVTPREAEAA